MPWWQQGRRLVKSDRDFLQFKPSTYALRYTDEEKHIYVSELPWRAVSSREAAVQTLHTALGALNQNGGKSLRNVLLYPVEGDSELLSVFVHNTGLYWLRDIPTDLPSVDPSTLEG